jgi:hypothetical protein
MALRIRLTKIEEWWQSFQPGLRNRVWRRHPEKQPEAGLLKGFPVALPSFRHLLLTSLLLNLCFLFSRESRGIEETEPAAHLPPLRPPAAIL